MLVGLDFLVREGPCYWHAIVWWVFFWDVWGLRAGGLELETDPLEEGPLKLEQLTLLAVNTLINMLTLVYPPGSPPLFYFLMT